MSAVIACDPGGTTGFCVLSREGFGCFSVNHAMARWLASWLLTDYGHGSAILACEKFVPGKGAGAIMRGAGQARRVISDISELGEWKMRSAAAVKPWATDKRLERAGLLAATAKSVDARDAARHALYAAVADGGWPDPLAVPWKWGRPEGVPG